MKNLGPRWLVLVTLVGGAAALTSNFGCGGGDGGTGGGGRGGGSAGRGGNAGGARLDAAARRHRRHRRFDGWHRRDRRNRWHGRHGRHGGRRRDAGAQLPARHVRHGRRRFRAQHVRADREPGDPRSGHQGHGGVHEHHGRSRCRVDQDRRALRRLQPVRRPAEGLRHHDDQELDGRHQAPRQGQGRVGSQPQRPRTPLASSPTFRPPPATSIAVAGTTSSPGTTGTTTSSTSRPPARTRRGRSAR